MTEWEMDDDYDPTTFEDAGFCECGVTGPLNVDGECSVCAGAPHHRECPCDDCSTYWAMIERESAKAAEEFNQRLVCTCGWTGAYIEHHADRDLEGHAVTHRSAVDASR